MKRYLSLLQNGCIAAAAASTLLLAAPAHAQTTFFQTGFETSEGYSTAPVGQVTVGSGSQTTTFQGAPGLLVGQPRGQEKRFTFYNIGPDAVDFASGTQKAANSSTVVDTGGAGGSAQSAQIVGSTLGTQEVLNVTELNLSAASNAVLNVGLDLRVSSPSATAYGQWGLIVNEITPTTLQTNAAFGLVGGNVLASNDGSTIYAAINPNTGSLISAAYGVYNNYSISLNYATRTISGFFNGSQVAFVLLGANGLPAAAPIAAMPFRANAGNTVSSTGFGQALPGGSTEVANFDNYRVTGTNIVAAPEPSALSLLGAGAFCLVACIVFRAKV